jgi:hypothetical protein
MTNVDTAAEKCMKMFEMLSARGKPAFIFGSEFRLPDQGVLEKEIDAVTTKTV